MDYISKYKKYKNKYLELKGGASLLNNFNSIQHQIDNIRFDSGLVILRGTTYFQIIDRKYNKRYLINKPFEYFFLYDGDDNIIYLFNKDGVQIKLSLEAKKIMDKISSLIKESNKNLLDFRLKLTENKILHDLIQKKNTLCFNINLSNIYQRFLDSLDEINSKLNKKCGDTLYLKLDNYYNLHGNITIFSDEDSINKDYYMLCLYYNDKCISSIYFYFINNYNLQMFSKTNNDYLGNKYIKLLYSVIILLASDIMCNSNYPEKIICRVESHDDALFLISKFKGQIDPYEFDRLFKKFPGKITDNQTERIILLYSLDKNMDIEITINQTNQYIAMDLINLLTATNIENSLICPKKLIN